MARSGERSELTDDPECDYTLCHAPAKFRVQYTDEYQGDIRDADIPVCGRHLALFTRIGAEWMDPDPACVVLA